MYKILKGKLAVPADLALNPGPSRGTKVTEQRLTVQNARTTNWNKVPQSSVLADSEASYRSKMTGQVPQARTPFVRYPDWGPGQVNFQMQNQIQ